jgi:hypothetical protein
LLLIDGEVLPFCCIAWLVFPDSLMQQGLSVLAAITAVGSFGIFFFDEIKEWQRRNRD